MFYLYGIEEIKHVIVRSLYHSDKNMIKDNIEFRQAYSNFLKKHSVFDVDITEDKMKIIDFNEMKYFSISHYHAKSNLYKENSSLLKQRIKGGFFNSALCKLALKQPRLYELSSLIIKVIIVNHLNMHTSGTSEDSIGLASINFKDLYTEDDFIELVIHQLTHMLLFIDNFTNAHVLTQFKDEAIITNLKHRLGGNSFPFYKVFHSFIVGVEILAFRNEVMGFDYKGNYHGTTQRIVKTTKELELTLVQYRQNLTLRGRNILASAILLLSELEQQFKYESKDNVA